MWRSQCARRAWVFALHGNVTYTTLGAALTNIGNKTHKHRVDIVLLRPVAHGFNQRTNHGRTSHV